MSKSKKSKKIMSIFKDRSVSQVEPINEKLLQETIKSLDIGSLYFEYEILDKLYSKGKISDDFLKTASKDPEYCLLVKDMRIVKEIKNNIYNNVYTLSKSISNGSHIYEPIIFPNDKILEKFYKYRNIKFKVCKIADISFSLEEKKVFDSIVFTNYYNSVNIFS